MSTLSEEAAMRLAITLSAFGLGTTSPNPPVGCVVLDHAGRFVGQGYHRRKGEAHAEVNALAAAGDQARDGTAVVTLEPCNHYGITPPCHEALIRAGIRRVLVAVIDPTSRGEGGVARLRQAGVDVETGVLDDEARLVLGPWLTALTSRRPYIIWPHVISRNEMETGLGAVPDSDDLRRGADVVLRADGSAEEAVPGCHLPGVLRLQGLSSNLSPMAMADTLYEGGVRIALLDGGSEDAAPFLEAGLIQRVMSYLPVSLPFRTAEAPHPPGIPRHFQVRSFERVAAYLRVDGVHL